MILALVIAPNSVTRVATWSYAAVGLARVTNQIGRTDLDFFKGQADGVTQALKVIEATIAALEHGKPMSL